MSGENEYGGQPMRRGFYLLLVCVFVMILSFSSQSSVYYVDDDAAGDPGLYNPDVSDPNEDGSPDHPFDRIEEAIGESIGGDTVIVRPGSYYENITINKEISLTGSDPNDSSVVESTVIDGQQAGSVITIADVNEPGGCQISGLTITNGYAEKGGGIYCDHSNLIISHSVIVGNEAKSYGPNEAKRGGSGGGIYCISGSLNIFNCNIHNNASGMGGEFGINVYNSGDGGGIYLANSFATIEICTVQQNNTAAGRNSGGGPVGKGGDGGGIYVGFNSLVNIFTCIIKQNSTGDGGRGYDSSGGNGGSGGGIYNSDSALSIEDCMLIENQTGSGGSAEEIGGNGGNGGGLYSSSALTINNCIISQNLTGCGGDSHYFWAGNGGSGVGVFCGTGTTVRNCTITMNIAGVGGLGGSVGSDGSDGQGAGINANSNTVITNTIVWNNLCDQLSGYDCTNLKYCDIQDGICSILNGNINVNPSFADPNNSDFHLKSQAGRWDPNQGCWVHDEATSPCIDTGDPLDAGWKNELWPHGKRINMGAYGGTAEASMSLSTIGNIADINHDDAVDYRDFQYVSGSWQLPIQLAGEDLDRSQFVDVNDLTIFAENWLQSTVDQAAGLVGYWKLDDEAGLTAVDVSGLANHGVLVAEPNWTAGLFEGGLSFTEADHAIEISTENMNSARGTVSVWAYADEFSSVPQYLFGHAVTADPWSDCIQLYVDDPNGGLNLGLGDSHVLESDCTRLQARQWTHIVLTWEAGSYAVYVNAESVASGSYTGLSELADIADIGNDGSTQYGNKEWKGILDEVKLYNRSLSGDEVIGLFESGVAVLQAEALTFAREQIESTKAAVDITEYPINTVSYASWVTTPAYRWSSGFFPGSLWYLYEQSGLSDDLIDAQNWTAGLEDEAYTNPTQDLGFMIFNTFGKGYQLTGFEPYRQVVFDAADTMTNVRFQPAIGAIVAGWGAFEYSVNIDSMMAVEMLFWLSEQSGDLNYAQMAISHADRVRSDHVRPDGSTWQYSDYDPITGALLGHSMLQGQSVDSTWSRGQGWGIYGFTVAFRETQDPAYLDTACKLADYYVKHLPADSIPYWDFDAVGIPDTERDSSAAAVAVSALLELSELTTDPVRQRTYYTAALRSLLSMCTPATKGGYLAVDTNGNPIGAGIVMQGCYNHGFVCDESLSWGDYYFLEALIRLKEKL